MNTADDLQPPSIFDPQTGEWELLDTPFKFNAELRTAFETCLINDKILQMHGNESCQEYLKSLQTWLCCAPQITTLRVNSLKISTQKAKSLVEVYLNQVKSNFWRVLEHPVVPDALIIKTDKVSKSLPKISKEVIVDVACASAVLRGAHVYAPGIVGAPSGMKPDDLVSIMADIEGKCCRGLIKPFTGKKVLVGIGKAILDRKEILATENCKGLAVEVIESMYNCPSIGSAMSDITFLQNLPSIICGHILEPKPGELVLDMCAAPGGKTTHIASLMNNQGKVIALDKIQNKLTKILENASRCGITCIQAYCFNSTKAVDHSLRFDVQQAITKPPYAPETFDRILLDVPCSALGQRPQLNNQMSIAQLKSYPPLQQKLMRTAVALLKKGGILVYSTCTLNMAENEEIVRWTLENMQDMRLVDQHLKVGYPGRPGTNLPAEELKKLQRFEYVSEKYLRCSSSSFSGVNSNEQKDFFTEKSPQDVYSADDTIGFFIAKFTKI